MAESEAIQIVVMQRAIQATMAVVMAMRETNVAASSINTTSLGEACRQKHGRPA